MRHLESHYRIPCSSLLKLRLGPQTDALPPFSQLLHGLCKRAEHKSKRTLRRRWTNENIRCQEEFITTHTHTHTQNQNPIPRKPLLFSALEKIGTNHAFVLHNVVSSQHAFITWESGGPCCCIERATARNGDGIGRHAACPQESQHPHTQSCY